MVVPKRNGPIKQWMIDIANKHDISAETVQEFYRNLEVNRHLGTLRERTESFFDLYFEEVNHG